MLLDTILVHPITHVPLQVDWDNKEILLENNVGYKAGFQQNVPYILPENNSHLKPSQIHEGQKTEFDYQDHYQRDAQVFDYFQEFTSNVDQEERNRLNKMIISRIPDDVTSILDVGCGRGWLAKSMVSNETSVISMDISSRNPIEALKKNPHPNHEGLIADVYHLPLQESSIDCIVASEIMEHVPDPTLFVEKLIFVLKPGGKLMITTPYDEQIVYHLCVHCNRPTPGHAHLHSFNEENIEQLIPDNVRSWQWEAFSNKHMSKIRAYVFMKRLPFKVWNAIDQVANKIWRSPMRLMIEVYKNGKLTKGNYK